MSQYRSPASAASKSTVSEAKLVRKASPAKRQNKPPQVIDGQVHQRENQPISDPQPAALHEVALDGDNREKVSPALERASSQTVQRATQGLIRLESRRRMRSFLRRLLFVLICAGVIGGMYYFFADALPIRLIHEYWEQLKSKILLAFE